MSRRATIAALLGLSALALVAAKNPRRSYVKVHEAHTEQLLVYFGFATALNLRATLLTAEMRAAMKAERSRLMAPTPENRADYAARMDRDLAAYHEIVFSADSGIDRADRFGTTDGQWNVRLVADGVEQPLVAIEEIRRPTPVHHALFPHLNHWSDLWIARFERVTAAPARVEVVVGSGYGNGTLVFTP